MPEAHDGDRGTHDPWPAPVTPWPAPVAPWPAPSPATIVGFVASAHVAPAPGTALRSATLDPPHPSLQPVGWGRWPGYASRPIGEPVAVAAASVRSVFEIDDDVEIEVEHHETADPVVVPLLPATALGADRLAPAAASPTPSEPATPPAPSPRRRPVWGWAAAVIVGVGLGVLIAPQRSQAPQPTLVDDRAGGPDPTDQAIAPADPVTATTPLVAQLPPVPPAPGDRDVAIDTDFAGVGDDEWVRLTNTSGADLDLTGWQMSDDGRTHVYVFGPFVLPAGASVTVSSACGADTPSRLFWCAVDEIWNDGGDVVTVVMADGTLVATATG